MYRIFITFLVLLCLQSSSLRAADTLKVVTHNKLTVVTDPSKGFKTYSAWGKFPPVSTPIRKILLKLTLGCPDEFRCADWDYKDHITLRRKGGITGDSLNYEIGRMLTPYGGAFGKKWNFTWEVDVTDFSMLLRDSVEIEYNHTGYEPNTDRGWSVTLTFELIKGTPALEPIAIEKVYDGSFRYGDSVSINDMLRPFEFDARQGASMARLRVVQTGHGMDRPDNCAEFCNKYRETWFDGKMIDRRNMWKPCGDNPLYPQAGTWLYDRANWCPGDLMQPDVYDLPVRAGSRHTVQLRMQDYKSVNPSADQVISAYLIHYRKPAVENDATIVDVVSPSNKDAYKRLNPSVNMPKILVKNNGSQPLRSLQVKYGNAGKALKLFSWHGTIAPQKTDTLQLPGIVETIGENNLFDVQLLRPNGKKDAYDADNKLTVAFKAVPKVDSQVIVYIKTNREPTDNGYTVVDQLNNVIQHRAVGSMKTDSIYRDTLTLSKGLYRFVITDTAANGLEFWANPKGGFGKARLLNAKEEMIRDIESDFGSYFQYDFEVNDVPDPVAAAYSIIVYPTRTNDKTTLDYFSNTPDDVTVELITDPGNKVVERHVYHGLKSGVFSYDLSRYHKGRFYLKVFVEGKEVYTKRIRFRE